MGVLVNVQVGQKVEETTEGPIENKVLVSANYPTTTIEVQRIIVYEKGDPIYKTVIPETWSCCSKSTNSVTGKEETKPIMIPDPSDPSGVKKMPADKLKTVPVKTDTANGLKQVAADNKSSDTWSILNSEKVATGLRFKDQSLISNADAAGAAQVGENLINNVHHLDNVSKYYDVGTYDQGKIAGSGIYMKNPDGSYKLDPSTGWYMIDGRSYGADIRKATVLDDRSRITQNAYTEVKPFANVEAGWRNAADKKTAPAGLLTDPSKYKDDLSAVLGTKLTEDATFANGVNKYTSKSGQSDIAIVSGGQGAKVVLTDPKAGTSVTNPHKDPNADPTKIGSTTSIVFVPKK